MDLDLDLDVIEGDMEHMDFDDFPRNSLLAEDCDSLPWEDVAEVAKETFEEQYVKIQNEQRLVQRGVKKMKVAPVKKKYYKIKINDLLFSERYKQLKLCVMENRIHKMEDIEKMLHGEPLDEDRVRAESEKFLKQRQDHQLLTELCKAEMFVRGNTGVNDDTLENVENDNNQEKHAMKVEEQLLEDWI